MQSDDLNALSIRNVEVYSKALYSFCSRISIHLLTLYADPTFQLVLLYICINTNNR